MLSFGSGFKVQGSRGGFAAIIYGAMPDQESFSPLPLEGADERSEAGLASPCVKIPLHVANLRPFGAPPSKGRREGTYTLSPAQKPSPLGEGGERSETDRAVAV